jgi:anaerobic selenocysteine-containing dehydrogenase
VVEERIFTCNLCEALCGLRVSVDGPRVVGIRGDPEDVLSHGHICPKAHGLRELLEDPDRLRAPVKREADGFHAVAWSEALDTIAERLRTIQRQHGRDAVAIYVGNPVVHSHRGALASQLLTNVLGTKNRYDPNSQDSNPRLFACMQVYGDALAIPVPDMDRVDYLLVLGANPAASNGSMMALGNPRARFSAILERGGTVVLIDPRRTETAAWASRHHFIRPGGDAALLFAMLHVLFEEERVDLDRIRRVASGVEELRRLASSLSPERVAASVGIDSGAIRCLARELCASPRACVYARVGVCQGAFGPVASWLVEALNIVTGNFDREGGSMFPTPAADVAPLGRMVVGNHYGRWRSRVRGLPEFLGALPSAVMAEEIETPGEGQIRALVCIAGNPVLSTPNGERLARALGRLDLLVSIDLYLNETARLAHFVLPSKHIFETRNYDVLLSRFTVRNAAKYSAPIVETQDETRDDWTIAVELASRLALPSSGPLSALLHRAARALARDLPERVLDALLRLGPHGLSLARLRTAPHGVDLGPLVPRGSHAMRTPDRRARLAPAAIVADVERLERWVDAQRSPSELVLIGRRHLRSNNSWMHNRRSLTKGPDRSSLLMHPADGARLGLVDGGRVRVRSRTGELTASLTLTSDVMQGIVSLPHGYGHASARATLRVAGALPGESANALTDELFVEPIVGTSVLNGVPVTVEGLDAG